MKNKFLEIKLLFIIIITISSCKEQITYDIAIKNVSVFDSKNKEVIENQTILINTDTIVAIVNSNDNVKANQIIQGNGRLVTPGFVDTHIHLTDIYGGNINSPEILSEDSLEIYREKLSETYLRYGTTTIKVAGQPQKWNKPTLVWQKNPQPQFPDIFISGGALISDEERKPYVGHTEVMDPDDAEKKIQTYYDLGIKHIKLYSRLRDPEFRAAFHKAKELNMNICSHVENSMSIDTTLDIGLIHYEHVYTLLYTVFNFERDWNTFIEFVRLGNPYSETIFSNYFVITLEAIRFVEQNNEFNLQINSLIDKMGKNGVSCSSTIHLFAEKVGSTYFTNPIDTTDRHRIEANKKQKDRYMENFDILMKYTKRMHDKGVQLNIGTDCRYGGKAILSEMLLFYEAGFTVNDILQIATINGAKAIDMDQYYGSLEPGKKANLVIFDKNPFDDYKNFLSRKIIIKDGKVYQN